MVFLRLHSKNFSESSLSQLINHQSWADLNVKIHLYFTSFVQHAGQMQNSITISLHSNLLIDECQQYYDLLNQADLLINASSLWAGFSATVEAMHRHTAVLTAPYAEFQALFGKKLTFGDYLENLTPDVVAAAIASQLHDQPRLAQQQQAAHHAVESFTWEAFVDRLFQELADLPINQPIDAPVSSPL